MLTVSPISPALLVFWPRQLCPMHQLYFVSLLGTSFSRSSQSRCPCRGDAHIYASLSPMWLAQNSSPPAPRCCSGTVTGWEAAVGRWSSCRSGWRVPFPIECCEQWTNGTSWSEMAWWYSISRRKRQLPAVLGAHTPPEKVSSSRTRRSMSSGFAFDKTESARFLDVHLQPKYACWL